MEYPKQPGEYNGPFTEEQLPERRRKKFPAAVLAVLLSLAVMFSGAGREPDGEDPPDKPELPESDVAVSELIPAVPDWYDPEAEVTVHFDEDGYAWAFDGAYFARMYWRSEEAEVLVDYACSYPAEEKEGVWTIRASQASGVSLHAYEEDGRTRLVFASPLGQGLLSLYPLSEFPGRSAADVDASVMYQVKDKTAADLIVGGWSGLMIPEQERCPFCVSFIVESGSRITVYESDTEAVAPGGEYRESVYEFDWRADGENWTRILMEPREEFFYQITYPGGGSWSHRRDGTVCAWLLLGEPGFMLVFQDFAEPMPLEMH